ncbi:MAG: tRNA (adenosine(37)-N6)-threonylcarbamoyltransferase complex ATPase subunit type 1 TsaE [Gammaproteobacteria bacterium]|nr:tRNA (adenosine(37)-N6)-threonylcarbamoyltransferase complex ATPase subunit type 1 TsaE [Gammaproteobacteria bacterium]
MLIPNETQLMSLAGVLAKLCQAPLVIYLQGELGAGKTTFSRGFLSGLGYQGRVKSPTYTLVETYSIDKGVVSHFDFYRIQDPEELDLIGIREYFHRSAICLIEWPELGQDSIPAPDITCVLDITEGGRLLHFLAESMVGKKILADFTNLITN